MPRTEFYRPNPLDSDVIMDATARLLAPRRPTIASRPASDSPQREARQGNRKNKRQKSAQPKPAQPKLPQLQLEQLPAKAQEGKGQERKQKAAKPARSVPPMKGERPSPAPQQKKKAGSKRPRHDRPRGMPPEPRRSQTKDSTEQPSLMKPYYLDIGR